MAKRKTFAKKGRKNRKTRRRTMAIKYGGEKTYVQIVKPDGTPFSKYSVEEQNFTVPDQKLDNGNSQFPDGDFTIAKFTGNPNYNVYIPEGIKPGQTVYTYLPIEQRTVASTFAPKNNILEKKRRNNTATTTTTKPNAEDKEYEDLLAQFGESEYNGHWKK